MKTKENLVFRSLNRTFAPKIKKNWTLCGC